MKKKKKAGNITLPHFKLYYESITIKTVWYWHKRKTKHNNHQKWNTQTQRKDLWLSEVGWVCVCEMGEAGQKVQTSSYKTDKL